MKSVSYRLFSYKVDFVANTRSDSCAAPVAKSGVAMFKSFFISRTHSPHSPKVRAPLRANPSTDDHSKPVQDLNYHVRQVKMKNL